MNSNIQANVVTDFSPVSHTPRIDPTSYIHAMAAVIGNVFIGKRVMVSPTASVRGDEGQPIHISDQANVQDGVVIHALETFSDGAPVEKNLVEVSGENFAVFVGKRVSLAHQCQIHGPAFVADDSFIGMQALVFKASVGANCVVEPKALLMGVIVAEGRYVPAGSIITTQQQADELPEISDDYPLKNLNAGVVHVNTHLADAYNKMK